MSNIEERRRLGEKIKRLIMEDRGRTLKQNCDEIKHLIEKLKKLMSEDGKR